MYPILLEVKNVPCLVVGGGHVALRKVKTLMEEGAHVTVIAPDFCEEIKALAADSCISLNRKSYEKGDGRGYRLVITATGLRAVAEEVKEDAEKYGILCNSADFPDMGNFFVPARFRKEGLMVTVSTEGKSPALAKYMKEWLADQIPEGYGIWLERVTILRQQLKEHMQDATEREHFWRLVLNENTMKLVRQGHFDEAEESIRRDFSSIRSQS